MTLKNRLMTDLKEAMKSKDKLRKDVITMVRAEIKQREVDERRELQDQDILDVVSRQMKERKNAVDEFAKGNRQDLVDQTKAEMAVLLDYLPQQLSEDEVRSIVKDAAAQLGLTGKEDIGKLMKEVMPKVKGKTDGKVVNAIAMEILK